MRLLNGFSRPLTYKVPANWPRHSLMGSIIRVPLQKREEKAIVERVLPSLAYKPAYAIREAICLETVPEDKYFMPFIKQVAGYYQVNHVALLRRVNSFLDAPKKKADLPIPAEVGSSAHVELTQEQQEIYKAIEPSVVQGQYAPSVIHGVTSSGKTEVYKKLIELSIAQGKSVVFMVPEVTLAVRFTSILKQQLSATIQIFSFHSSTGPKEKRELWQHLLADTPVLIIGVHLPIMLPLPNLGCIIIDEEHESGYQEKRHPRLNSRELAIMRAQQTSIPIILGSATPSSNSLHNVKHRGWKLYSLRKRFSGEFPKIKTVILVKDARRESFWISTVLKQELRKTLAQGKQAIIFLNRRGRYFFALCKQCGFVPSCTQCSVSLTVHEKERLICHYCAKSELLPASCTSCGYKKNPYQTKGIGTQQVVNILKDMFPKANVERADLDTTTNKKRWSCTLESMLDGSIDILVGTQTITKGYHFPNVTLVGIIWGDLNLHFPFYNTTEKTLQQLIQVAGRAGRTTKHSTVVVQTMAKHQLFEHINEHDYDLCMQNELEQRAMSGYPPSRRLTEIELRNKDEVKLEFEASAIADQLRRGTTFTVLGPAQPPVSKIQNVHSRKIYIKSDTMQRVISAYQALEKDNITSSIFFTPNPQN
ncbi:primosomal protein N' [bacterium]|nr:primosomal protein N' [bacterium]